MNTRSTHNGIWSAALKARQAGLCTIPPKQDGTKAPDATSWVQFERRRPTEDEFHAWFDPQDQTGLGTITGRVSAPEGYSLNILDWDDGEILTQFEELASQSGAGDLLARVKSGCSEPTPKGGLHGYVYVPLEGPGEDGTWRCEKLATRPDPTPENPKNIKTLIETKCEGGFIICSPSYGRVHPSGRPYGPMRGGFDTIATITAAEYQTLCDIARAFDVPVRRNVVGEKQAKTKARTGPAAGDLTPGTDYERRAAWSDLLPDWTTVYTRDSVTYLRRPGKEIGVSASLNHGGHDYFYCFSTSTEFEARQFYTKFGVYTLLHHDGDFSAAARALAAEGYGTRQPGPKPQFGEQEGTNGNGHAMPDELDLFLKDADGPLEQPARLTDVGNAQRMVAKYGRAIRFCHPWKAWLIWDGKRWREDNTGRISRLAMQVVRAMRIEAARMDKEKRKRFQAWAIKSEERKRILAMIGLAQCMPGIPVLPEQLNTDPMLLNVRNGTLNLKTGSLEPHNPADLITKLAPVSYNPTAQAATWNKFLTRVMTYPATPTPEDREPDDPAARAHRLIGFLSRAAGLALTADISDHALFFLHGDGRNGKGTYLNVLLGILGEYACTIDASLLMAKKFEDHPTGLTDLDGRRFVTAEEPEAGRRLGEALIKKLTGGNIIKARRMREDFYEFEPVHKIFLAANHKPTIRGTDEAIWSRLNLIPFNVFIPPAERIGNLDKKLLREEASGILNWCLAGCLAWQQGGLQPPPEVMAATKEYRVEQDVLGRFLAECCHVDQENPGHYRAKSSTLYAAYRKWAEEAGEKTFVSQKRFSLDLKARKFEDKRNNSDDCMWFHGIGLRQNGKTEEPPR